MTKNNKTLEHALRYHDLGWSIFPVGTDKKPLLAWKKYQSERATPEQIIKFYAQAEDKNIGVATGPLSGIVVLDLDSKHGWSSQKLRELGFDIPLTASARTGNLGEHFFFKYPLGDNIQNSEGQLFGEGVDIRGAGGFIVLAPSVTSYKDKNNKDVGGPYEWIVQPEEGIADMPEWLLARIKESDTRKSDWRTLMTEDAPEGMRNGIATTITGGLLRTTKKDKWETVVWPKLQKWNRACCKPPLPENELRAVYESIVSAETKRQDEFPIEEEKESQKVGLMKLVTSNPKIELFRDNYGNGHAHVVVDGHKEIMICRGVRFRQWLSHTFMEKCGDIVDPSTLNTAIHAIESLSAFKGKMYKLHNRVAKIGDTIWLDLADEHNRSVRITPEGWEIVNEPPILFRRHAHQKEQVEPERGGNIRQLFEFVNVTEPTQQLLLLVYLVACFIPDFPHALLYIHGEQGSAKSTLSRILRRLVDPSKTEVLHMPRDERELKLQLSRHHLVFYENVDGISNAISTVLCIGVTGGSTSERLYFTNGEDFIFDFQLNIGINGINISAVKPDLLERSLLLELKPVDEKERRDEADIFHEFEPVRAKILGAILDTVSKALAIRPNIKLSAKPRMADFALWGVAISEALGHTKEQFLEAYNTKIREQSEEALMQSVEATVLISFMRDKPYWKGSPQQLLSELSFVNVEIGNEDQRQTVSLHQLPNKPQALMRCLNQLKPNLRKIGIEIISGEKESGSRVVVIRKIDKNVDQIVNTGIHTDEKLDNLDDLDDIN